MSQNAGQDQPAERPSTLVDRGDLPGVRAREEINELLRAHDPETAEANLARLLDRHGPLLRRIAREPDTLGRDPQIRRNAVTALGRLASVEDLNVLTELATRDEDELIRGNALIALADTGLHLAVPLVAEAQTSSHPLEATAARKALSSLVERLGRDAVEGALRPGQRILAPGEPSSGEATRDPG
ncbi:HEAT repeat domain-containing protein [Actinomadura chokoriensis]|uniref:HEAT repeat domain-containing protein n=1 Tax=Actinomadura chokoriensis TaxID=454156 RepID=A0ABV4R5T2_9ACTN